MKKYVFLPLILIATLSVNSQWFFGKNKIEGNGKYVTVNREVEQYNQISISGFFDVNLVAGTEGRLILYGEENLLEYLITEVENGILKVKVKKGVCLKLSSWKKGKGISVTVPFEDIDALSLAGSGDIVGKDPINPQHIKTSIFGSGNIDVEVVANSVEARVVGSGDLRLKGTAERLEAVVTGSGDIYATNLNSKAADVKITGSGDIKLHASEELKARITGSGDIRYSGNPEIQHFKVSGSGEIRKGVW